MRSRLTLLILSIFLTTGLLTASHQPPTLSIEATDSPRRHFVVLDSPINALVVQRLKLGKTYQIFLSGEQIACHPEFLDHPSTNKSVYTFEATAEQKSFKIKQDCGATATTRISLGCTDCTPMQLNSMMGISVDENYSPQQLIQDVFIGGNCFDVDDQSISYTGEQLGSGYFSNGSTSINIEEGIILSTGSVYNSAGPNNSYNAGNTFFNYGVDEDLEDMVNSTSMYDVSALEFDFTPTTDQISFEFVFASEEYCEYVNSNFNDAFGFFISGPGINGPFSNDAENIAIVPNTNDYTAINSVNHLANPGYYVNNIPVSQHDDIPDFIACTNYPTTVQGIAVNNIEYDGFTTVMTAMANVQACETYHIKLVIADISDGYFDSAVFLKANSFSAGDVANVTTQAQGGADANTTFETCQEGYFVFTRATDDLSDDLTIDFTIDAASTATAGVDYETLPESIVIPAGDSVFYLPVIAIEDQWDEGVESIMLQLDAPCSCEIPFVEMFIEDMTPLEITVEDFFSCGPSNVILEPSVEGGLGLYTYEWQTGATSDQIEVWVETDTSYALLVRDECGNTATTNVPINIVEDFGAELSGDAQVCAESPTAQLLITFTGPGPWDLTYSIDNSTQPPIIGITENPFFLETTTVGNYELLAVMMQGCPGTVQGTARVQPTDLAITIGATDESCPDAADAMITTTPQGGTLPYQFNWDNGIGITENPNGLSTGTYTLTLTDANGCSVSAPVDVELAPDVPLVNAGSDGTLDCNNPSIDLSASASDGSIYVYEWTSPDGSIVTGATTLTPTVDGTGTYFLNVTNTVTGCTVTDKTEVFIDTLAPEAVISLTGESILDCLAPSTVLDASASTPDNGLSFFWTTADGNILGAPTMVNPEVDAQGTYELLVTNTSNGCTDTESIFIEADFERPTVSIQPANLLTCIDSLVVLDAGNSSSGPNYTITWTSNDGNIVSGENTLSPAVDQPGTYAITIFNTSNDCENTTSVIVEEDRIPPIADAGLSTELDCNEHTAILDGSLSSSGGNYRYVWSTNEGSIEDNVDGLTPLVMGAGIYELLVINIRNGCTAEDQVIVSTAQNIPTDAELEIFEPQCFGDEGGIGVLNIEGGVAPYLYSIDGGLNFYNENLFLNLQPGNVTLTVQDAEGCQYAETVVIPAVPELIVALEPEVDLELGDTYQIEAFVNIPESMIDTIFWTPTESLTCTDCLDPVAMPLQTTAYQILVTDENGCPATAKILLRVDQDKKIFIPNVFSPNDDGANDRFFIHAKEGLVANISNVQVFNRWGGKVFEASNIPPNDPFFGWDGTDKGRRVNPSVFIYFAEIEFINGEKVIYKGDVTVTK